MSLNDQIDLLAARAGTEDKALRTLINNNVADLSALTTTAQSDLVSAINEVNAAATGGTDLAVGTNDALTLEITSSTGNNVILTGATALLAGLLVAADKSKLDGIAAGATANSSDAFLLDRSNHTGTQLSATISDFNTAVDARVNLVVDGAPLALDTLNELAAALNDDANFGTTVNNALANRLRFDAAQVLTPVQQQQGQDNLNVYSRTEIGPVNTDYVATFEAALV